MAMERALRLIAGIVVTGSVTLSLLHSPYWLGLTLFSGLNLFQSGITNWCPMVWILEKAGMERCSEKPSGAVS
jgi:hypothetical protein